MPIENPREYIYKGLDEEQAILGNKLDWDNLLRENKISAGRKRFKEWINILQKIYPENPTIPKKKWGRDLYNFVADQLRLDIDDEESLKFYKTLGTDLDRMGIDCFFAFKNPKTKKTAIFTIDVTINPHKDEAKADMIVNTDEIPDHRKNQEEYIDRMEEIAETIAENLKEKTEFIH